MKEALKHPDTLKFLQKMRDAADANGLLNYRDFTEMALYDHEYGYYRREATRVGRSAKSDFYTSQSLGPVFGALVMDAVQTLLKDQTGKPIDLKEWTLVEVGYEADAGWWEEDTCPFAKVLRIGPADKIEFSGRCVLFSNELFDAQPFHRLARLGNDWKELGVDVSGDNIQETILPQLSSQVSAFRSQLPLDAPEGYLIDLPLATRPLLQKLTRQQWEGLFLALDYGKSWSELAFDIPHGTARAYYRHRQTSDLLAQPGMQDITCHICWDWLKQGLEDSGFQSVVLESQEAFFVKHALQYIQAIVTKNAGQFDPIRQSLMHLIHPATMGQQFQVLWGYRPFG